MRKRSKFAGFFIFLLIVGLGVLGYFFYKEKGETKDLTEQVKALEDERAMNSKTAWVALEDIRVGEELIPDVNIEVQQIYSGVDRSLFWQPDDGNGIATTDIPEGIPVFASMATGYAPASDARQYEISAVNLMTTQADYDFVDVRISFPDGSDYVVLAKKQIHDLSLANCVFNVEAGEDEIHRMQSAILDAYMTVGAKLYTTAYTESSLQPAATPNYPVKNSTLLMLLKTNNANLRVALTNASAELNKQARRNLEERLGYVTDEEAQAAATAWAEEQAKFQAEIQKLLESEY